MSLKYVFLLLFVVLCSVMNAQEVDSVEMDSAEEESPEKDSVPKAPNYQLDSVSEAEFSTALLTYRNPILYDSLVFQKKDGVIKLPILKMDSVFVTFRDTFFVQREAELEQYKYVGQFYKLGFYVVEALFYEDAEFYLINKKNGSSTAFWTLPKLSQNKKYFANIATRDGIFPSGIQIWSVVKSGKQPLLIQKIIQIDQEEWIPEELVWTKDNVLLLKVLSVNNWLKINRDPKDYFFIRLSLR